MTGNNNEFKVPYMGSRGAKKLRQKGRLYKYVRNHIVKCHGIFILDHKSDMIRWFLKYYKHYKLPMKKYKKGALKPNYMLEILLKLMK